jgi:hypothetical protein
MFHRSISRRVILTATFLVPLAVAATACGSDNDGSAKSAGAVTALPTASAPAPVAALGASDSCSDQCSTSVFINVTNNSSHDLLFVKNDGDVPGTADPAPIARIPAHGGTDGIEFKTSDSHGAEYIPIWRVDGSEDQVIAFFQVPIVGANQAGCDGNNMEPRSKSVKSTCSIQHGGLKPNYHPDATLVITDR